MGLYELTMDQFIAAVPSQWMIKRYGLPQTIIYLLKKVLAK